MAEHEAEVVESTDLAVARPGGELAIHRANPIAATLDAIVSKGVTPETAAALEKITDLYIKMEDRAAGMEFAAAKAQLQAELPRVSATRIIPDNQGNTRSIFANYEDIMGEIQPLLTKHGFAVSFTIRAEQGRMIAVCKVTHAGGHSETNEFSVRVGQGPPKASEAQSDGAARSFARRGALCDAFNIVIDHDTDARSEGDVISPEQAAALRDRLAAVHGNEAIFLKLAGADSFEAIREGKLSMLEQTLATMEARAKGGKPAGVTPGDMLLDALQQRSKKDCQGFPIGKGDVKRLYDEASTASGLDGAGKVAPWLMSDDAEMYAEEQATGVVIAHVRAKTPY